MTDPDAVARALSRLAGGVDEREGDPPSVCADREGVADGERVVADPEPVVAEARAAMAHVHRAAAFVASGGETRLRRAVEQAEDRGEVEVASRGRAVLRTLEAFRRAANDDSPAPTASEPRITSTPLAQRSSREGS